MQQLENAILQLLIELMGGEANLRKGVATTRNSLHNSFDTVRNATVSGVTNLPERFKQSLEERKARSGKDIANGGKITDSKLQEFLRTSEPGMSEHERNYISGRSTQIAASLAKATNNCKQEDVKQMAIQAFKFEIKNHRETYSLLATYKRGGDKTLTQACNFDKEKKEHFYHSLPDGKQLYERLNQAKLEGKDTAAIEKEIHIQIDQLLTPNVQANTKAQAKPIARDTPDPGELVRNYKTR